MKKDNRLFLGIRGIAILIFTLLLFVSCSDHNIVNDENNNLDLEAINSVELAKQLEAESPGLAKQELQIYELSHEAKGFEVSSEGYTASFEFDGIVTKVEVPEDSYDQSKWGERLHIFIKAEKWLTTSGIVYYYTCTPHGVEFKRPLILHQPYENSNSGKENLYWYNPDKGKWVVEDKDRIKNGVATFEIDHFSKYAIAD